MGITTTGRNQADDYRAIHQWLIGHPNQNEVVDVANRLGSGTRYARELLAVLVQHGQIDADHNVITGSGHFEQWLAATAEQAATPAAKAKPATPAGSAGCRCGCGEPTSKAKVLYRPGHDARHAGQVARAVAALASLDLTDAERMERTQDLLATLPTDALTAKASAMADRLEAKAAGQPATEKGTVKVGRWSYFAERTGDAVRYVTKGGDWKNASAKQAATFTKA